MSRVALNAARTKIVDINSLEAAWVYPDRGEAERAMEEAKRHPLMQARMAEREKARLAAEEEAAKRLAAEARARRVEVK